MKISTTPKKGLHDQLIYENLPISFSLFFPREEWRLMFLYHFKPCFALVPAWVWILAISFTRMSRQAKNPPHMASLQLIQWIFPFQFAFSNWTTYSCKIQISSAGNIQSFMDVIKPTNIIVISQVVVISATIPKIGIIFSSKSKTLLPDRKKSPTYKLLTKEVKYVLQISYRQTLCPMFFVENQQRNHSTCTLSNVCPAPK